MLQSALEHYRRQHRIAAAGLAAARRERANHRRLTQVVSLYQRAAAEDAVLGVDQMLAEQDLSAPLEGRVNTSRFGGIASDGRPLDSLLAQATDNRSFDLIIVTQLADAARVAAGVSIAARPGVQGYVRMLSPPSCPRCVVLAGKWFGWSKGFDRHPRCDCRHVPAAESVLELRTDPRKAFEAGQVRGLTQAETKAITEGSDISRVVNARRSRYVDPAGHRMTREATTRRGGVRGPRPTPEEIYRFAGDDRGAAIRALKKFGYIL